MMGQDDDINTQAAINHTVVIPGPISGECLSDPHGLEAAAYNGTTKRAHIKSLIAKAAEANGVTYDAVMSRARPRNVCSARFDAIAAVASAYPDMSFPRLGRIFGRDHSTVVHALMMRGVPPRSKRVQEYKKFAALMQRKVGATPTEGEATNENP